MNTRTASMTLLACAAIAAAAATNAAAAPTPNKLLLSGHFGDEVNKNGSNTCTPQEECQPGKESSEAGGFLFPAGVAVNNDPASPNAGDLYLTDNANHRVQVLTPQGAFVSMFGWDVNRTKVEAAASQPERNVCTAVSGDVCQAGLNGSGPERFAEASSIAIDPASGEVYVADFARGEINEERVIGERVQKFTAEGRLILEIGKEVNEATKGNFCNAEEVGAKCTAAALTTRAAAQESTEPGAFDFVEVDRGNLLTVGGPQGLLYVGDHGRVQKFKPSGEPAGEVSLASLSSIGSVTALAVDATGNMFLSESENSEVAGVHEFNAGGQLQPGAIDGASLFTRGLAFDPHGNLAIIENNGVRVAGGLYTPSGAKLSTFDISGFPDGLAFASSGSAYIPEPTEVDAYDEIVFPQTRTCPAGEVTATSARLCGEVNPDGVKATGFFQYGQSPSFASLTPVLFAGEGEAFVLLEDQLTGLVPNQAYDYRVAVEATVNGENLLGTGDEARFHTPVIPPQIPGEPTASFVTAQTAVLSAQLNPEHTPTRYHFEYGPCATLAGCPSVTSTGDEESAQYPAIGTTQEIRGLASHTTYSYRLVANNELEEEGKTVGGQATGAQGTFTTGAEPFPQAFTGGASAVTAGSATITGTVNPDGKPATYTFELGVWAGAATQFGIVASGSLEPATTPVEERHALTGLQPGTTYAYRIRVRAGTGEAVGAPATFTTAGLPSPLASPAQLSMLPLPPIAFPSEPAQVTPKTLTRGQRLARALKACTKKPSRRRAACRRKAEQEYGPVHRKQK